MSSASDLFRPLAIPQIGTETLTTVPFPGHDSHRIAKNAEGHAIVLIRSVDDASRLVALPVRTEHLHVMYSTEYRIQYASGTVGQEVFTAITCLNREPAFVRYFLNVVAGLLDSLGPNPATGDVVRVVRTVVELFRTLTIASKKAVQGVWAELFLIATSRDKAHAARSWHATPHDRYDFVSGLERLDVKSSGDRERRHYFSHDQLSPPAGATLWIASVFAERTGGGVTLEEIINRACDGLGNAEAARVRTTTADTLGAGFVNALEVAFDFELASDSLRYYRATSIPHLSVPLPTDISEVHYRADLATSSAVDNASAASSSFLGALPLARS